MSLNVLDSKTANLQEIKPGRSIKPSPSKKMQKCILNINETKIKNSKQKEELEAKIAEKKEKLEKIQNLLNKKEFNNKDKSEYLQLTESNLKKIVSKSCAIGVIGGSSAFLWGALLGASTIATGGGILVLAGALALTGFSIYDNCEVGNILSIEHSPYQCERQADYTKKRQEIHQKMINNLKIVQTKILNEIKTLENEIRQF